ncbi:Conserved hypothetical protein [Seminavis robusta]|uniref:Uncharacterized protein n=1 Tax=Seminavis robusta TaxID=568900 RepID=A0A9N8ERY8_9STRA|nr:Conserved hypothetical protein [Seminavis robusta]|eukprot:Sro1437_g272550.1 Conserved hypothetical protein (80) ;mRNA; f:14184-14657
MGGGGWWYVPKVWSPSGGWWCNPPNWKRNTAVGYLVVGVLTACVFKISADNERRPVPPRVHIPSQYWCKHAKEDDPRLA